MTPPSPPLGYQIIQTQDGSYTLFSEAFQESCHSLAGAREETLLHYIQGTKILERIDRYAQFQILEVGFGLGVGFLSTLHALGTEQKCDFLSLEKDPHLLKWFKDSHPEMNFYWEENKLISKINNFTLTVLQGDARVELPLYLKKNPRSFHAIFQDAFTPKKNPSLWTKEWFTLLREHSHEEVILSTYSASTSIRKSLHESGWGVQKGEKFGMKKTSTRARLNHPTDPEIALHLSRSEISPLTDDL